MANDEDPLIQEVTDALLWYGIVTKTYESNPTSLPIQLRTGLTIRLESTIERASAPGSVYRRRMEELHASASIPDPLPILAGYLMALLTELSSTNSGSGRSERTRMNRALRLNFPTVHAAMVEASPRNRKPSAEQSRQAIDSSRNAFENFFKAITGQGDWKAGLDRSIQEPSIVALIRAVYSYLSTAGTHSKKGREVVEARLARRLTEEVILAVLEKTGRL